MNLSLLLDMAADGFAERTVVGRRGDGLTAGRLRELSIGGAAVIAAEGADALLYLAVNGPLFPIALFSAAGAGVPLVPLNYRLGDDQLSTLLANHPGAIAVGGDVEVERLRAAGVRTFTAVEWSVATESMRTEGCAAGAGAESAAPAVIIYTSGSTSTPKGVLIRHDNLVSYVLGSVEFAAADAEDAALVSVPPYHIAAVANCITNLYAGRRTVVLEQFGVTEWLDTVRAEGITHALVVPTMLAKLMDVDDELLAAPSLRSLAYGGAPIAVHVIERALRVWPTVDFVNAYGLTETSSTISLLGPDDHRAAVIGGDLRARQRLSSAGRPVPAIDVQIRDEDGHAVTAESPGRIWVRGSQVSGEYLASGSAVDDAGYFDTRDRGYLDDDGYLFILGRADDTIIRGAENIAPAEIEDVLLAHPDVADAVVVGVPDAVWGERIAAAVVLRPGTHADGEWLQSHVRTRLRASKTPERIVFWRELPRTETGKLIRREVVARIEAG